MHAKTHSGIGACGTHRIPTVLICNGMPPLYNKHMPKQSTPNRSSGDLPRAASAEGKGSGKKSAQGPSSLKEILTERPETFESVFTPSQPRIPPHDMEAEQSTLGSLMLDPNAVIRVADFLRPIDFYKKAHRVVYQAILDLFRRQEPIDILALSSKLKDGGVLEEIGGRTYLTQLINAIATPAHVVHYAKIVQKKCVLRELISASYDIGQLGWQEAKDVDALLDEAERRVFSISQQSLSQEFLPVKHALADAFERIEQLARHEGGLRGVPTGFTGLDHKLSGLQKSDFVVLAARPSLGKTALAMDIARSVALREHRPVGIFSLEMSKEQLVDRLIAAEAGVNLWKLRTGRLSSAGEENDFDRIRDALGRLAEAPIFIDDAASATALQMRAMARRLQAEHDLALIIVDYLQLMTPHTNAESMVQQVTEISRSLKALARELNVPVLALSQLSRSVEGRPDQVPKLSDLRESGAIEQDADVVMFIYREDRVRKDSSKKNIAEIHIAKHRNGPTGKIELYFDEEHVSFRNLEKEL